MVDQQADNNPQPAQLPWTLDPDEFTPPADIPSPPWTDKGGHPEEAEQELSAFVLSRYMRFIQTFSRPPLTVEQIRAVHSLARLTACYGWCAAMRNGPMSPQKASKVAVESRKAKAEENHRKIVAAYEAAATSGQAVDIDALAEILGIHRSTVYRAIDPK